MKKLLVCACILCLLLGLCGCGRKRYRDDVSCKAITDKITDTLTLPNGYASFGEEHMRFYFADLGGYADKSLVYSALSEDVNEIGVFRAEREEDVAALRLAAERYLDALCEEQRAFVASYAPKEVPKLDGASVRVFGHYVVYAVLTSNDQDAAFACVESLLTES